MPDLVVVGLGYVGLPLVQAAVRAGLAVAGLDANAATAEALNAGSSHVDDLTDADVAELLQGGFRATVDPAVVKDADVIVICVPTPLSGEGGPDLSAVRSATESITPHLRAGALVVLESTTYPGTTEGVVKAQLERSGLAAGADFNLAFSPERIDPGNPSYGMTNTPKIVGGLTPACTERAAAFYGRFVDTVVRAKGTREAEMAKLLENTYRHVNIALVNEMAQFARELGVDLWDVIRCAETKPFGFQAFRPGPGVGGHCIPIDPNYLSHTVKSTLGRPFRFVELAQEINAGMPAYVASRAQSLLNDRAKAVRGSHILLLGITYKADIADERESPARPLARILRELGAELTFHDPLVDRWWVDEVEVTPVGDPLAGAAAADLTVLLQPHREYDLGELAQQARLLFDTRGSTDGDRVVRL